MFMRPLEGTGSKHGTCKKIKRNFLHSKTDHCKKLSVLAQMHSFVIDGFVQKLTLCCLITGLCVQTDGSPSVPAENANLQLGQCKQSDNEKFWLIPRIMYTIRHHSGLCLHHSTGDNLFKLQSRQICDRFMFDGIFMKLLHVKTRKYLCEASSFMQAEGTCDAHDSLSYYSPDSFSLKSDAPTRCLQPAGGLLSPVVGTKLILGPCSSEARFHFKLYDERCEYK